MDVSEFFVYGLYDEDEPDVIRYVGQTASLDQRFKVHNVEPIFGPAGFWKWSVKLFGRKFRMVTLETVTGTRQDSLDCETATINRLESQGRLLNGPCYRRTNRAAGVHRSIIDSFFSCLRIVQILRKVPASEEIGRAAYIAARTADELETKFKSLRMCGAYDSFAHALRGEVSPLSKVDGSIRLRVEQIQECSKAS